MPNLQRKSLLRLIMSTVYRVISALWGFFFRPSTLALFCPVLNSPRCSCVIDTLFNYHSNLKFVFNSFGSVIYSPADNAGKRVENKTRATGISPYTVYCIKSTVRVFYI